MRLGDLQALAEDQRRLKRATQLANELTRLDAKRAGIIAELEGLGIEADQEPGIRHQGSGRAETRPDHQRHAVIGSPAAAAAPLTWEAAYEAARERILGPWLRDGGAGNDVEGGEAEKRIAAYEDRRRGDIEALARELLASDAGAAPCLQCPAPATTTIAGSPYCDEHARTAPRPVMPPQLRVA